jgi:hypothetical protein
MSCKIIKLVPLANLPNKLIDTACKGTSYLSKQKDIDNLDKKIADYDKLIENIREIDKFNNYNNLMSNWKQVKINYRNEQYTKNVGKYTEPLILSPDWNNESIKTINNIWDILYDKNMIQSDHHLFARNILNDAYWIYNNNYKNFEIKYGLQILTKHLKNWGNKTNHNFYPVFNTIETLKRFNISDFSATGLLLTEKRNRMAHSVKKNIDFIKEDINAIEFSKKLKCDIKKGKHIEDMFTIDDLISVFPYDKHYALWLHSMHNAILSIDGGIAFIENYDGNMYEYFDSPIGKKIENHPLVLECGHTGFTFSWCVINLAFIYNNNWILWVKKIHDDII